MGDWGFNPVHGYGEGPYNQIPFPAPPGMAWIDVTGSGWGRFGPQGWHELAAEGPWANMQWGPPGWVGGGGGDANAHWGPPPPWSPAAWWGGPGLWGGDAPWQQPGPVPDGGVPGINLRNHDGGIGLEPGYNYLFPEEHCKIFVVKSDAPPWELAAGGNGNGNGSGNRNLEYKPHYVPCNTTLKELMKGFGCDNADAEKNVLHEITPGGNGTWYKGLSIKGDDKDRMKKTVAEMGWSKERNGREEDVVWVWFTK